jgi:thiosulfate reductase cytochrome b subunit
MTNRVKLWILSGVAVMALLGASATLWQTTVSAQTGSPLHPTFPLVDADGVNVLDSGAPVSTMMTCGGCHDTEFIERHSIHASQPFDTWNPLTYYQPDEIADTEAWIQAVGVRHTGGGLAGDTVEMNCFLCHTDNPANDARIAAIDAGELAWANSATLLNSEIVMLDDDEYTWNSAAFDGNGALLPEYVSVQDPTSDHCGQCHGEVHTNAQIPLELNECDLTETVTATTGQVHSPQRLSNTGLNITGKSDLRRTFDVHAERALACNECHYAANNPVYFNEPEATRPDHLQFDPRRMDFGDYLERPVHQFAGEADTTIRDCADCHDMTATHDWLPYKEQHTQALACESCHVPTLYAPALNSVDWTVPVADGEPAASFRGVDNCDDPLPLIEGYQPTWMQDSEGKLAPYNMVSYWYWVAGEGDTPIALDDVNAAWFDGDDYHATVLEAFDADNDGDLSVTEQQIDTAEKEQVIRARLEESGYENPLIIGDVRAYPIHHNVINGEWAIQECETCHADNNAFDATFLLAANMPANATLLPAEGIRLESLTTTDGALYFLPDNNIPAGDLYVFGNDRVPLVDWIGILALLGVMGGVTVHGGIRYIAARRRAQAGIHTEHEIERVYMYTLYERQWHWLQTVAIFILLFTGLIIHRPNMFGVFSFRYVVQVHNIVGAILVINAALAAFYHLASGEIRQYIPQPRGLFYNMFEQIKFYVWGIFRGWPHPFHKDADHKLNPLQQLTYLAILNVLLPAQVITGLLMWGAERFPQVVARIGGLAVLAPIHALVAWLFASFIILHVYLTTTGHTPLAGIQAMMLGWDDVEADETHSSASGANDSSSEGVYS